VRIIATALADLRGIARLRYGRLTHAIELPVPGLAPPRQPFLGGRAR
jgi:hypothetical protein